MTHPNAAERYLRVVTGTPVPAADPVHEQSPDQHESTESTGPDSVVVDPEARAIAEIARARAALPPIDPAVFRCYLGEIVGQVADWTEGDPVNVLVSLLCVAGVHLGPGPHVRAGDDIHPLLVWPLVVGKTNSGRKGAGWSSARRLAVAAAPDFMTTNVRSGLTSGEGLAAMFTTDPNEQPTGEADTGKPGRAAGGRLPPGDQRLVVFEAEWAGVMERMKRDGNALSATLRGAWEGGDLSTMTVTARIAPESHVGIVGHITPEEFRSKVSGSDLAGGTYNRFLPVMVSRSQFLPGGQGAPDATVKGIGAELAERFERGAELRALGFTPAGERMWRELYVEFGSEHGDMPQVEQFISRAAPYCLRIAAIHTALDNLDAIDVHHLTAAAALVRYSIASARTALTNDQEGGKLAAWIAAAGPDGRTRKAITTEFFGGHKKADYIRPILDGLTEAGRITVTKIPPPGGRGGRAVEIFTARAGPAH